MGKYLLPLTDPLPFPALIQRPIPGPLTEIFLETTATETSQIKIRRSLLIFNEKNLSMGLIATEMIHLS